MAKAAKKKPAEKAKKEEAQVPAVQEPTGPMVPAAFEGIDDTGYEGLDPDSLMIPRIKIVQPTSQEGTPGTFRSNLTGEEEFELPVIVLKVAQSRVMYDSDNPDRDEPLCRSFDFINPDVSGISDVDVPVNPVCAERIAISETKSKLEVRCPKARWINRVRPDCDEVWNLLCLDETGVPFWFSSSGASIRAVKAYISSIALRRMRLYQFSTVMTLDERKQPHRHYALRMSPAKSIDPAMAVAIADTVIAMRDVGLQPPQATTPAEGQDETDPGADESWMDENAE